MNHEITLKYLSDHTGICIKYFFEESDCPYYPIDKTERKLHSPMCCDADGCKCLCLEICPNKRRAHAAMSVVLPTDEFDECAELNPNLVTGAQMKKWKEDRCIETQTRNRSSVKETFQNEVSALGNSKDVFSHMRARVASENALIRKL